MYDKCQGYSKSPHFPTPPSTNFMTPIYMPKQLIQEPKAAFNLSPVSSSAAGIMPPTTASAPASSATASTAMNHHQHHHRANPNTPVLQSLYTNYLQTLQSAAVAANNSSLNENDTVKLHKFYHTIPFKCPFCFQFKEVSGDFIEHLTSKHFLELKLSNDKLNSLTNANKLLNGTAGSIGSAFKLNKREEDADEPSAKRFMYTNNTANNNNDEDNDEVYNNNHHEDEDDEENGHGACTSSCCNNGDEDEPQQQQQQPKDDDYPNHRKFLMNKNQLFNKNSKYSLNGHQESAFLQNKFNGSRSELSKPSVMFNKQLAESNNSLLKTVHAEPQQQMLNLSYLMSSVSSMHCAICNRGFEYYSNLRRHIKTKHKIFGKEVKEYVIRHNNTNGNSGATTAANQQHMINQFQRSQSLHQLQQHQQQQYQINSNINNNNNSSRSSSLVRSNSININSHSNNNNQNRSNSSTPSVHSLNSKIEANSSTSIKHSPKAFDLNNNRVHDVENDEVNLESKNTDDDELHQRHDEGDACSSPSCLNNNSDKNESVTKRIINTANVTPVVTNPASSCISPISTVSSHSSTYSTVSPTHSPPSQQPQQQQQRPFSPMTQQHQQILSNMSSCMSAKYKTSLLETLLTRKAPQNKNEMNSNKVPISSDSVNDVTTTTSTSPVTPQEKNVDEDEDEDVPQHQTTHNLSPQALYQLAQQQQQFIMQNNLDLATNPNEMNQMNDFKKFLRNFARFPTQSQQKQLEDMYTVANGGSGSFFANYDKQQQYLQQHLKQKSSDTDSNSRFYNNSSAINNNNANDEQYIDDDCQSNNDEYDDIENSNCSSFNNNTSHSNDNNHHYKMDVQPGSSGFNTQNDSPLNMKNPNFNNNSNSKFDANQVRYSTEVWRCPYCCYETTSASRYNSHLVCHGWKPYLCPHCGSRSNRLPDMRTHISTFHPEHNVNTFVMLNEDEAKATLKDYMKNRALINRKLKEMRPQPKFKCKLCPYASLYQFNLTKHVKSVHLTEVYNNAETKNDIVS